MNLSTLIRNSFAKLPELSHMLRLLVGRLARWRVPDMPILPAATVACGFILTAAWVDFLGFELFRAVNFIF